MFVKPLGPKGQRSSLPRLVSFPLRKSKIWEVGEAIPWLGVGIWLKESGLASQITPSPLTSLSASHQVTPGIHQPDHQWNWDRPSGCLGQVPALPGAP